MNALEGLPARIPRCSFPGEVVCAGGSFSSSPSDPDAETEMFGRASADNGCLAAGLWAARRAPSTDCRAESCWGREQSHLGQFSWKFKISQKFPFLQSSCSWRGRWAHWWGEPSGCGATGILHHFSVFQELPLKGVLADIIHEAYVPSINSKHGYGFI